MGRGAYRVYAKWFERGETEFADGTGAGDDWSLIQTGFRADVDRDAHGFTVQGDYQHATQNFAEGDQADFDGANLLGSWTHSGARVKTRVQSYFDYVNREKPPSGIAFDINTFDIDIQQSADFAGRHQLVWGLGRRVYDYDADNNVLAFVPHHRDLHVTNLFVQDGITLSERFKLTAGVKLEENTYSGWQALPDLRLSWSAQ